jgi:hypothetical protein
MKYSIVLICSFFYILSLEAQQVKIPVLISDAEKRAELMIREVNEIKKDLSLTNLVSPRTLENGKLKMVNAKDWTSGFFPGELWLLYALTGKPSWKEEARIFTKNIEGQEYDRTTHDLGFKVYCSAGNGFLLTKDTAYKKQVIAAATTLSKRFNPVTGTIKSWDNRKWGYPVIIDNMMNLELLFEASKLSGDQSFYKIAVTHANTTMKNHFRADYSSYHVLDYDTVHAGNVVKKGTAQGYADESAWARGQAWGLYGYTLCYRETKDPIYLHMAEKIAGYILHHPNLPKDGVPYWDYNAPNIPNEPRDASAAAITASALLELSLYSKNKKIYLEFAHKIMSSLSSSYRSALGENANFILLHSTGSKPANSEVDVPLIYADYYYLEALLRMKRLQQKKSIF